MPEALLFMNGVLSLSAGAGLSPRRARYFSLLRQRKVPKRKATPSLRPLRVAKGQTCGGAVAGCAVELALRCRAPLGQPRRVSSRSMGASTPMLTSQPPRRRRSQQGVDSRTSKQPDIHSGHRFARPRLRSARRLRPRGGAERSKGPCGCSAPLPLWMRRGAQGLADQGSRVSERRAAARVERDPAKPEHRRLPRSEAQGTQTAGSPFLWFLSFGDAKERDSHAGRLPASALNKGMRPNQRPKENTTKTIAASAYSTSASSQKHPKTTRRAHP
jgi:hypothetical protein